jgi:RNA polymerase sigma factor (sigma-70 family)
VSHTVVQERFLALLDQHRGVVHKVAGAYGRTPADREDLAQEIIAQLWRSFPSYDPRLRFSTWMYRIALNTAISGYRSESVRGRHTVPADEETLQVAAPEPDTDERLQELYRMIQTLNEMDRALVILYLDGNRYDAIAEVLGISESNVGTRLNRIRTRLRDSVAHPVR